MSVKNRRILGGILTGALVFGIDKFTSIYMFKNMDSYS